jgi:hypothetical protein
MISKLQTLVQNIKASIDGINAQPSIIKIVYNETVNKRVISVTLDKARVNTNPLSVININTGAEQSNTQVWNGLTCTITTASDVVTPFMIVIQ